MSIIASQNTFALQYEKKPRILRSFTQLSSYAKDIYTYLYNIYINSTTLKSDNVGQYLTVSRKAISEAIGKTVKSVIGYVKELSKCGLIKDRRMGVKEINRIYFIDVNEKHKYDKHHEVTYDIEQIETDQQKGLIQQVKEILSPLENINSKVAKRLLMICNNDLDVLVKAATYTAGKQYNDLLAYISKVIKDKLYDSFTQPNQASPPKDKPKPYNKGKPKQVNKFTSTYSHGWDLEKLQQKEALYVEYQYGDMSEEEYNKRMADLD